MLSLYTSPTTPFGRKVAMFARELGIWDKLAPTLINPWENTAIYTVNPLGKIPALVLEDGSHLIESDVICDYLASLAGARGAELLPPTGAERYVVLRQQALADGLTAAGILWFRENGRVEEKRLAAWMERQLAAVTKAVVELEAEAAQGHLTQAPTLGAVSVASTFGWVDLRLGFVNWRAAAPALAAWYATFSERPSFVETVPVIA
jgi:glutathione S-transferase